MDHVRQENERLRLELEELELGQDRAKNRVAEYIYQNELEKKSLQKSIVVLQDQIKQLRSQVTQNAPPEEETKGLVVDEQGEIKAGFRDALIEALYKDNKSVKMTTTEYANVFVLTYRSFATPELVLDTLIKAYEHYAINHKDQKQATMHRLRIGSFLKKWVVEAFHDFDQALQDKYSAFVTQVMSQHDNTLATSLDNALKKAQGDTRRTSQLMFSEAPPKALAPKSAITSLLDIDPLEVARQLTLMDYEFCKKIRPKELLGLGWTKKDKEERSPNLLCMIRRFNSVSKWVAFLLVDEMNISKRQKLMNNIVKIMAHLKDLNNFNAVFQFVAGLENACVYRLSKTKAALKPSNKKTIEDFQVLVKATQSWANYRKHLHNINPPCVPFMGVYQTDLTFVEEGNPDTFADGKINFKKCRMTGAVIAEIQQYQQKPYNLAECSPIREWLERSQKNAPQDDAILYEKSLQAEPREPKPS